MVIITTTDKSVKIQMPEFVWDVVKTKVKGQIPFSRGTQLLTEIGNLNIFFDQVEADGQTFDSAAELQEWVRVNCFKAGGGAPGEGVQSVTGTLVSGTALNPVINMPSAGDVGAATSAQGELAESAVQPGALGAYIEKVAEPTADNLAALDGSGSIVDSGKKATDFADASHTHTATQISDSTLVGRAVLTANDAAAARSAMGAGTSSLAVGTESGTAMEGNSPVVRSVQEESRGFAITNYLPITQADYDALSVKNATTAYDIIEEYPS